MQNEREHNFKKESAPLQVRDNLQIIRVYSYEEADKVHKQYPRAFFIECSFGEHSYIPQEKQGWGVDHHGELSSLPSAFEQAYGTIGNTLYGCLLDEPKPVIVVAGFPDEDACGAAATALGIIPHWSFRDLYPAASDWAKTAYSQNLSHVAQLVGKIDRDPNAALELVDTYFGRQILAWRQQANPSADDILAWWGGIDRMRTIFSVPAEKLVDAAVDSQEDAIERLLNAPRKEFNNVVWVVDLSQLGRNSVYYKHLLEKTDVLVAFVGNALGQGSISLIVKDVHTAKQYFGQRGLIDLYPKLPSFAGSAGGREIIGGLDRDRLYTWEDALKVGEIIKAFIQEKTK